jgi:hypothetical protein
MPSEEELDRFVAQFPIVRSTEVAAVGGAQVSPGLPR